VRREFPVRRDTLAVAGAIPNHGGLTPAAVGCGFDICRATFDSHGAVVV
jgi:hypothetical protein